MHIIHMYIYIYTHTASKHNVGTCFTCLHLASPRGRRCAGSGGLCACCKPEMTSSVAMDILQLKSYQDEWVAGTMRLRVLLSHGFLWKNMEKLMVKLGMSHLVGGDSK